MQLTRRRNIFQKAANGLLKMLSVDVRHKNMKTIIAITLLAGFCVAEDASVDNVEQTRELQRERAVLIEEVKIQQHELERRIKVFRDETKQYYATRTTNLNVLTNDIKVLSGPVELFDLRTDANEFDNLAGRPEHADTQKELETKLWNWMESVDDPLLRGPVRTPCYDSAIREYHSWQDDKVNAKPTGSGNT